MTPTAIPFMAHKTRSHMSKTPFTGLSLLGKSVQSTRIVKVLRALPGVLSTRRMMFHQASMLSYDLDFRRSTMSIWMRSCLTKSSNNEDVKPMSSFGASVQCPCLMIFATSSGKLSRRWCGWSNTTILSGINGPMATQERLPPRQREWRCVIKIGHIYI